MDKVKFDALERAELEDIRALSDLPYEYVMRALGSVLGAGDLSASQGGLLTGPSASYTHATGLLTLSSFTFLMIDSGSIDSNGNSLAPETRAVKFDAGASDHLNSPVDISAARSVGVTYTLFARPIEIESDAAARRKWDLSSQQEISYTPNTRLRERVEFSAGTTTPAQGAGASWTAILNYNVDGSNTFTHTPISALDQSDSRAVALLNPSLALDALSTQLFLDPSSTGTQSRALGLLGLMSVIKQALYRTAHDGSLDSLYTPSSGTRWYSAPSISLGEASQRIAQIETRAAGLYSTFPFNIEIQLQMISGVATENVRITQTDQAPFTADLTVNFDNRYRSEGSLPSAWSTTSNHTTAEALNRIGHIVLSFSSNYSTSSEVIMAQALHTVHVLRDNTNTSTSWSSINALSAVSGAASAMAATPLNLAFVEETDLPNPSTPAPNARALRTLTYIDDDSVSQTVERAVKLSAYIDPAQVQTDATDNEGLTITLNYQILVRR